MSRSKIQWSNTAMPERSTFTKQSKSKRLSLLRQFFYYLCFIIFSQSYTVAQSSSSSPPDLEYLDLLQEYETYIETHPEDTGEDGFTKNFGVWQWWWEDRTGSGVDNSSSYSPYLDAINQASNHGALCTNNTTNQLNWNILGPVTHNGHRNGRVNLIKSAPSDDNKVYIGTFSSGFWRCNDITITTPIWENISDNIAMPSMGIESFDLDPTDPNLAYIAVGYKLGISGNDRYSVGLFKTTTLTNSSPTWTKILPSDPNELYYKIKFVTIDNTNNQNFYLFKDKLLLKTTNQGANFTTLFDFDESNINGVDLTVNDFKIDKFNPNILYIAGYNKDNNDAHLYKYNVTNSTLTEITSLLSHTPFKDGKMFLISEGELGMYILYKYENGNSTISAIDKTINSGSTWSNLSTFSSSNNVMSVFSISNENEDVFYLESTGRRLRKTVNNGSNFINGTNYNPSSLYNGVSTHADIRSVYIIEGSSNGLSDNILVGSDGGILHSTSSSSSYINWTDINGSGLAINQFFGLGQRYDKQNVYGGGNQDNGTLLFNDNGEWEHVDGGDGYDLLFEKNNAMYAYNHRNGGTHVFRKSNNYGSSFSTSLYNDQLSTCRKSIPSIQPMYNDRSDHVFTAFHDIHLNDDHGSFSLWTDVSDFSSNGVPENYLIKNFIVFPNDNNYMYAAFGGPTWNQDYSTLNGGCINSQTNPAPVNCGGCPLVKKLFRTTNALSANPTWTDVTGGFDLHSDGSVGDHVVRWNGITDVAVSDTEPNDVWVSFSGIKSNNNDITDGKLRVTVSHDGGLSFDDYSTNLPAFPINRLVYYNGSKNGLFAATDLGVYYTDDDIYPIDGWICVSSGLPPSIVSDIDINYCNKVIRISTYGRGLWEADLNDLSVSTELIVDQDESWDTPRDITGNVTITNNSDLTITSEVYMATSKHITIETGSQLIVDGGTITNACGSLWAGIYVQGDNTLRQTPTSNMGKLTVENGGVISNATTAVHNFSLKPNGSTNYSSTGGIIYTGSNAQFISNKRDVEFLAYQNHTSSGAPTTDRSSFIQTTFATTELLANGNSPSVHVTMWKVDGVKFRGCTFSSTDDYSLNNRGKGIYALDAAFKVYDYSSTPTLFTNLNTGIEVQNYDDYYSIDVNNSEFELTPYGIKMLGVMEASITENIFNVPSEGVTPYGLYMLECSGYKVEENQYYGASPLSSTGLGIVVKNKNMEDDNDIYRNEFFDLSIGVLVNGKNGSESFVTPTGLEILCNKYNLSQFGYYDFAMTDKGVVSFQQGTANGFITGPAGNVFSNNSCNAENSLFVSNNSYYFNYNHHANAETTPQNGCFTSSHITLSNSGILLTNLNIEWENACPSKLGSDHESELPGVKSLAESSSLEIETLTTSYETVVDGGDPDLIIQTINSPLGTSYLVRTELISYSPFLSDEVLMASINRFPELNHWHLAEVIIANSPISNNVWMEFEANSTMPDFLFNHVLSYQQVGSVSPRGVLEMQIKAQVDIKERASSNFVRGQMKINDNDLKNQEIIDFYALDDSKLAVRRKVAALVSLGNFTEASTVLSVYDGNVEYDAYSTVQEIVIAINEGLDSLNEADITTLYDIANGEKYGKYRAQAILVEKDGAQFDHPITLPNPSDKSLYKKPNKRNIEVTPILATYPNPADDKLYFTIQLPVELESAYIEIYTMAGKFVKRLNVSNSFGIVELETSDLNSGMYISTLLVNQQTVSSQNFVIQH